MPDQLTRCPTCGAPLQVGGPACAYCGAPVPGAAAAPPPPPEEISGAVAAIRARIGDPNGLLPYLAAAASRLGRGVCRPRRSLLGGGITGLHLTLGTVHYEIRRVGPGCVVERESVAAGMAVGMRDTVPASRWPELLVLDVARTADERGLGWRAVGSIFV